MTWLYSLSEYLTSFVECFVLMLIYNKFFDHRFSNKVNFMLRVICGILITKLTVWMNTDALFSLYTLHTWIVIMALLGVILNHANFIKTLCISIIYMVILCATDLFGLAVIELIFGGQGITLTVITEVGLLRTSYSLFVKLLLVVFYVVFIRKSKRYDFSIIVSISLAVYGYFFFSGLQSMVNAIVTNSITDMRRSVLLSLVFVILFMISVFVVFRINSRLKNERIENGVISTRIQVLENTNQHLNEAYREIAKMSHDHSNQVRTMSVMAQNRKYSELTKYLFEIQTDIKHIKIRPYTTVDSIDAAINSKVHQAESKNIKIEISASYYNNSTIRNIDVCTIIVNLLDNAIEACERIDNTDARYIRLSISPVGGMIVIKVENSCNRTISINERLEELRTTKADGESHGYGLKIVRAIVKKYNGDFEINCKENKFVAIAMLMYDN